VILNIGQASEDLESLPDAGFGALRTARGNLPLRSMDVRAAITALIAGVEITQEFTNPFDLPLEATYTFPLPDRGAVTALRMEADGRVVRGVLSERAQARRDYDAAIAAGQRAAIAEEDRPNVFTMVVGNILPGEQVIIALALTQPLPYEDGEITFRFPLVVAPRFIPGSPLPGVAAGTGVAPDTDAVPDASRISPAVLLPGFPSPVRLSITADIDPAGLQLSEIRSSLHAVTQEGAAAGHTIVAVTPGERLDRDFILRLAVADADQVTGSLVLCPDDHGETGGLDSDAGGLGAGTFVLTLMPPALAPGSASHDVVILLDRSGSMAGWKMVAARRAAARIVDTLGAGDRFAAVCFDNDISEPPELAGALVAGTDRNRFRAVEFLAGLSARGGTYLLPALEYAADLLSAASDGTGPRQRVLVLVTDGQVGNEDQIISRMGPRLAGARVHVVGIDQAVNAGFLGRLAAIGRGRCELVESQDRLDEATVRIHQRILAPLITGLTMQTENLRIIESTVAPARMPDLFTGAPVTISGRFEGAWSPGTTITVRGVSADGAPSEQVLTGTAAGGSAATAIWARAHVRELEDSYTCLESTSPSELERLESQIVARSLRFGVLCRFTAFLAVDTRIVTDGGVPHRVSQPVELPTGWDRAGAPGMPAAMPSFVARPSAMLAAGAAGSASAAAMPSVAPSAPSGPGGPGGPARQNASQSRRQKSKAVRRSPVQRPGGPSASPVPEFPIATEVGSTPAVPDWARSQVTDELSWLDAAMDMAGPELARNLSDLGSRLTALITWLASYGVDPQHLSSLREIAVRLRACEDPDGTDARSVTGLRDDARTILRKFLADLPRESRAARGHGPGGSAATPFWKRPRRAP
jgi:Ca-activated chloride channel family protein